MANPFEAADDAAATADRARKIKGAMVWLKSELASGPQVASVVQQRGKDAGHAARTLQEAASRLHVHPQRVYASGKLKHWEWTLPTKKR